MTGKDWTNGKINIIIEIITAITKDDASLILKIIYIYAINPNTPAEYKILIQSLSKDVDLSTSDVLPIKNSNRLKSEIKFNATPQR
jgi:hypothetical protein